MRLDNRLIFINHTNELCKKTMPSHQSRCEDGRFRAFILSNFQYCPAIWHHCSVPNTKKSEKIQERALRYVTNDYKSEYRSLLCQTSLPSLGRGTTTTNSYLTFKMVCNLSSPYLQDLITPRKCTRILRNSVKTLEIPFYNRVRHETNSFSFLAPKSWNNLPEEIRTLSDLPSYRKARATGLYTTID